MSYYNLPRFHAFRFWCQKVLPLVYDDSLSYVEVLYKVVHYLNKEADAINEIGDILEGHGIDINQAVEMVIQYLDDNHVIEDEVADAIEAAIENGDIDERCQFVVNQMISGGDFDSYVNGMIGTYYTNNIKPTLDMAVLEYDTFADVPTTGLVVGQIIRTKGFYQHNDGGEAEYQVYSKDVHMIPENDGYSFKILGEVKAKAGGAKADGTTDDKAILESMFNKYRKVSLGRGYTYLVGGTIQLQFSGINIYGDRVTIQRADDFEHAVLYADAKNDITISGLTFDGGRQSDDSMLVTITGGEDVHIFDCTFQNSYGYCIRTSGCSNLVFENCMFNNVTGASGNPGGAIYHQGGSNLIFNKLRGNKLTDHLIYLDGSVPISDVEISDCICTDSYIQTALTNGACIAIYGEVYRCNITNCSFSGIKTGIIIASRSRVNTEDGYIAKQVSISNCSIHNVNEQGIMVVGTTSTMNNTQEIVISNCTIFTTDQDGIDLRYCNMANISGCNVQSARRNGIATSGCYGINITGCTVGNSISGIVNGYLAASDNCIISNCAVYSCSEGIYINGGNGNVVNSCKFFGGFSSFAYLNTGYDTVSLGMGTAYNGERSILWGSAPPSTGRYKTGDICLDNTGATLGWRCTSGGGPGTWTAIIE